MSYVRQILTLSKRGFTLFEVLVALVVLAMAYGVAVYAITTSHPQDKGIVDRVMGARREALRSGITATVRFTDTTVGHGVTVVTVRPDGSVTADSSLHIDMLNGRPQHMEDVRDSSINR